MVQNSKWHLMQTSWADGTFWDQHQLIQLIRSKHYLTLTVLRFSKLMITRVYEIDLKQQIMIMYTYLSTGKQVYTTTTQLHYLF